MFLELDGHRHLDFQYTFLSTDSQRFHLLFEGEFEVTERTRCALERLL